MRLKTQNVLCLILLRTGMAGVCHQAWLLMHDFLETCLPMSLKKGPAPGEAVSVSGAVLVPKMDGKEPGPESSWPN